MSLRGATGMKKLDLKRAIGGGGNHDELLKPFGGVCFEKQSCEEAKRHGLLKFELFKKIDKFLSLNLRNILISPLEGEKKFLGELNELRNKGRLGILAHHEAGFAPSLLSGEGIDSVISSDFKSKKLTTHENNLPRKELSALVPQYLSNFFDTVFSRFTPYFSHKRTAFTLAEVLITLGIIGIVAALTLPTLIANYRVSVLKNDFKKADTIIQQAIQKTVTEAGYDDITSFNIPGRHVTTENWAELQNQTVELNEYWLKQFSVTKAVTENELTKLKYSCSGLLGQGEFCRYYDNNYVNKMYFLSNGMLISPLIPQYGGINHPGLIRVKFDTNGLKGPNRFGYDIFIYESLLGYATLCSPVLQVNYSQWGCYYYAHKDTSPIDSSKSYWDILYKPKSYWTDSK